MSCMNEIIVNDNIVIENNVRMAMRVWIEIYFRIDKIIIWE